MTIEDMEKYPTLYVFNPEFDVPIDFAVNYMLKERLVDHAQDIVLAMRKGDETIRVSDPVVLSELGLIRREAVESESNPDNMYVVHERKCHGHWIKYFCSCPGFLYHGHCKHSLTGS